MLRHLVLSGLVMAVGMAALTVVWVRYGEGRRTLKRFAIAYAFALAVVAGISVGSETYRARCPDDPAEWCEYNDSVAAIATIAVVFSIAAVVRSWMLYSER